MFTLVACVRGSQADNHVCTASLHYPSAEIVTPILLGDYHSAISDNKCHEEVLYLQPMIPPKRFDIFPPVTEDAQKV